MTVIDNIDVSGNPSDCLVKLIRLTFVSLVTLSLVADNFYYLTKYANCVSSCLPRLVSRDFRFHTCVWMRNRWTSF